MIARGKDALVTMVSDHAVLRYLERRHGIDVEGARRAIQQHTSVALDHDAPHVIWDGVRFVIDKGVVVTALEAGMRGEKRAAAHATGRASALSGAGGEAAEVRNADVKQP